MHTGNALSSSATILAVPGGDFKWGPLSPVVANGWKP